LGVAAQENPGDVSDEAVKCGDLHRVHLRQRWNQGRKWNRLVAHRAFVNNVERHIDGAERRVGQQFTAAVARLLRAERNAECRLRRERLAGQGRGGDGEQRGAGEPARWLLGTHHCAVDPSHIDYYLDEFVFRFNRRTSRFRGMLFYRLMQQTIVSAPVTYSHIETTNPAGIATVRSQRLRS
jgi:hypothetical protein